MACGGFGQELASESVSDCISVDVRWKNCAFGVVDVVCPLMVDLWVAQFRESVDVVAAVVFVVDLVEVSTVRVIL